MATSTDIRSLPERSWRNLGSTWRLVRHRFAARRPSYPPLSWRWALFLTVLAIVVTAWFADAPLAGMRGHWPASILSIMEVLTDVGLSGWYLIPAAFWLVYANLTDWHRRRAESLLLLYNRTILAVFVLASMGLSGIAVNVIKYGIGRVRPEGFADLGPYALQPFALVPRAASFPSGHSTTMGALAAILVLLAPKSKAWVLPAAIVVALTRVVVGAHYVSDVVAGLALGFGFTILTAMVFARLGYLFRRSEKGLPKVKSSFRLL